MAPAKSKKPKGDEPEKKPKKRTTAAILQSFRRRARVINVFGAFNSRVMIELPLGLALEMFGAKALGDAAPTHVVTALEGELAEMRKRAPDIADSTQAAAALQLAYELQDPFNSATSKSMCARALNDTLEDLRDLAPKPKPKDAINELEEKRRERQAAARRQATAD